MAVECDKRARWQTAGRQRTEAEVVVEGLRSGSE